MKRHRVPFSLIVLVVAGALLAACMPIPSMFFDRGVSTEPTPEGEATEASQPPAAATEAGPAPQAAVQYSGILTGTVAYRERIALPADARIKIQLADVSRADAPAVVLAEQEFTANGRQVPLPFELKYDPAAIEERLTYALQARIEVGGQLRWINAEQFTVLTRGAPLTGVDMILQQVGATTEAPPPTGVEGRNWVLVSFGAPGQEAGVPEGFEITAGFSKAAGQVAGKAACNRYFATYTVEGDKVSVGEIGTTRMACPEEQMKLEQAYLEALASVESYALEGDALQLRYGGGNVLNFIVQE